MTDLVQLNVVLLFNEVFLFNMRGKKLSLPLKEVVWKAINLQIN